jgi:hypothetical protein
MQVQMILNTLAKMDDSTKTVFAKNLYQNGGCQVEEVVE